MVPEKKPSAAQAIGCVLAFAFALAATITGIWLLRAMVRGPDRPSPPAAVAAGDPPNRPVSWPPQQASSNDYFRDATSVPGKLGQKVRGPVRLLELSLYPTYAFAQIQDPRKKENVDRFALRDGEVKDGEPVRLMGNVERDLEAALFEIATVDFTAVPRMAADAVAQLRIEDGKLSHMILRRPLPFNKDVRWRVYVSGPRKSGSVEYDASGVLKKVWK